MATYWIQLKATTTDAVGTYTTGGYTPAQWRISLGGGSGTWSSWYGSGSDYELGASSLRLMFNYGDTFHIMVDTSNLDAISGVNIGSTTVCANTTGTGTQTYDGVTYTLVSGGGAALTHQQNIGTYSDNIHYWHSAEITPPSAAGNYLYKIRIAKGNGGNQTFSFAWGVQAAVGAAGNPTNISVSTAYSQQCTLSWSAANSYNATYDNGNYVSPQLGTRTHTSAAITDTTPTQWAGSLTQATVTRGWYYRVYARNFSLMHVNGQGVSVPSYGYQFLYQNNNANSWAYSGGSDIVPYKGPGPSGGNGNSLDGSTPVTNIAWTGVNSHTATAVISFGPYTYYRAVDSNGNEKAKTWTYMSASGYATSGSINFGGLNAHYEAPTGGAGTYNVHHKVLTAHGGNNTWYDTGKSYTVPDGADYIPADFDLGDDIEGAVLSSDYESAEITISGVTAGVSLSIALVQSQGTGWSWFKYDSGSGYTAYIPAGTIGHTVQNGYKIKVKIASSSVLNDYRGAKLTINTTYDWFKVTTQTALNNDPPDAPTGSLSYGLQVESPKSANTGGATGTVVTYGPNNRASWIVAYNTFNLNSSNSRSYTITIAGMNANNKGDFHIMFIDPSPIAFLAGSGMTTTRTNTGFTVTSYQDKANVRYLVSRV
tara:strand:- start:195 stop:2150 length:1956 start_codon:yes stop_codon:yes gene_type:complete